MKKFLMVTAVTAVLSATANASVINLDTSSFGGSGDFDFNFIQFVSETQANAATVTQTDTDKSGDLGGVDAFMELGGTKVASFNLNGTPIAAGSESVFTSPGYNVIFDYEVGGTAQLDVTGDLQINFNNLVKGTLWVEWDFDTNGVAAQSQDLAMMSLVGGNCDIDAAVNPANGNVFVESASACNLSLTALFTDGYFTDSVGNDLGQYDENGKTVHINYSATVSKITDLNYNYGAGCAGAAVACEQTFKVEHTASMEIDVPEPTTLAILGLGLLGFAGTRRRG